MPFFGTNLFNIKWTSTILGLLVILGVFALASYYPGRTVTLVLFGAASFCALAPAVAFQPSFYLLFTSAFLFLGFWAKCVVHFLLNVPFIEPIGNFDNSAAEWDRALEFACAGLSGVAAATLISVICLPNLLSRTTSHRLSIAASAIKYLFWVSLIIVIIMFGVNYYYAIIKIGFVPKLNLHPYAYVIFSFIVSWGGILWLLSLTLWLTLAGQWKPTALFYVSAVEGAFASLSMGSRSQMILHVLPAIGTYLVCARAANCSSLAGIDKVKVLLVVASMFGCSLTAVSLDRAVRFLDATPTVTAEELPTAQGCEQAVPSCETSPKSELDTSKQVEGDHSSPSKTVLLKKARTKSATRDEPSTGDKSIFWSIRFIPHELSRLVIMRWVGIEGVLVTTSVPDSLSSQLLQDGLFEFPSAGVDAIYQRMSASSYQRFSNFVFMTIPGPIAISSYSGSLSFTFIAMFTIALLFHCVEYFALLATRNTATAATAGVALAYMTIQMNFPRTVFFFTLELLGAIIVIAIFRRLLLQVKFFSLRNKAE